MAKEGVNNLKGLFYIHLCRTIMFRHVSSFLLLPSFPLLMKNSTQPPTQPATNALTKY